MITIRDYVKPRVEASSLPGPEALLALGPLPGKRLADINIDSL